LNLWIIYIWFGKWIFYLCRFKTWNNYHCISDNLWYLAQKLSSTW